MMWVCILGLIISRNHEFQSLKSHTRRRRAAWDLFLIGTPDVLWHGTSQVCLNLDVGQNPIWWCVLCSFYFSFLPIERVTGRKARGLQTEEIACKCQTFLSLLSGRRKQTSDIFFFSAAAAKSLQSCPTLCDPRDGGPSGSPVPGILQARTLERVTISFSNA